MIWGEGSKAKHRTGVWLAPAMIYSGLVDLYWLRFFCGLEQSIDKSQTTSKQNPIQFQFASKSKENIRIFWSNKDIVNI